MPRDEHHEELQSYYKLADEDMEQITKEWKEEFLVHFTDAEISDTNTIGSLIVTQVAHVGQSSGTKKHKNKDEVQNIESGEEEKNSGDNGFVSTRGGEGKQEGHGGGDEGEEEQGGGEATPPENPHVGTVTLQKRKVSLKKPSTRKKTCANKK
jgi:hypothetical protein